LASARIRAFAFRIGFRFLFKEISFR